MTDFGCCRPKSQFVNLQGESKAKIDTHVEVTILGEAPRHVAGIFPQSVVFVEIERCTDIHKAGTESDGK